MSVVKSKDVKDVAMVDEMDGEGWVVRALIVTPTAGPRFAMLDIDGAGLSASLTLRTDELDELVEVLGTAAQALRSVQ